MKFDYIIICGKRFRFKISDFVHFFRYHHMYINICVFNWTFPGWAGFQYIKNMKCVHLFHSVFDGDGKWGPDLNSFFSGKRNCKCMYWSVVRCFFKILNYRSRQFLCFNFFSIYPSLKIMDIASFLFYVVFSEAKSFVE